MSARTWKLGATGLGVLTLACAGMQLPSVPTSVGEVAQLGATTIQGADNAAQCKNLRAQVSFEEEYALGGAVALNWVTGGGGLLVSKDKPEQQKLQQYLNTVGKNLAAQSSRPTLPWTFGVLKDTQAVNAASAPGGYVFVTQALLRKVENEAQLAGVLAHEIAHVTLQHALKRYDDVKVSKCEKAAQAEALKQGYEQQGGKLTADWMDPLIDAARNSSVLKLDEHVEMLREFADTSAQEILSKGFVKDDEYEADRVALHLLVSAGYDPREYSRFLANVASSSGLFSHHPSVKDRQGRLGDEFKQVTEAKGDEFPGQPPAVDKLQKPPLGPEVAAVLGGK